MVKNVRPFDYDDISKENLSRQPDSGETQWLEDAFYNCLVRWQEVNNRFSSYGFLDEMQEILFFKYIKPSFIGMLNYYAWRCQCILFRPAAESERTRYYKQELNKSEKFLLDHADFCTYYKERCFNLDHEYFTRTFTKSTGFYEKLKDGSDGLTSVKDSLAAEMISHILYGQYLIKLLTAGNN